MKRILLALVALVVLVVAAGAGFWFWKTGQVKTKRGSPTIQFRVVDKPGAVQRPKRVVDETPWPTYGYDPARTHFGAPFRERPPYRWLWQVPGHLEFPPAVAYGKVYAPQVEGVFSAIDSATGKLVWQRRFHNCTAASPTVARGVVYEPYLPTPCSYASRQAKGMVIALDAKTGKDVWRRVGPPSESSTVFVDGVLYYGAWDGRLFAVDAKTGKLRWATQLDSEIDSSPAYHDGRIFIGTNGGHVYALDARRGRILWMASSYSHFPNGREYFYATPSVAYGRVFIGNTDGTLYAYGERTGDLLWAQRAGTYIYTAAAVWSRTVYVGSYDGSFSAFDAATGDLRWRFAAPSSIHGAPTVLAGLVYFSTCGVCGRHASRFVKQGKRETIALDARTGRPVWTFPDGRYSPIVADRERVYLVGETRILGLEPCARRTDSAARRRRLKAC
jgi:outer membrane protein assembly factor BamB